MDMNKTKKGYKKLSALNNDTACSLKQTVCFY